jgi:hypothetical protein
LEVFFKKCKKIEIMNRLVQVYYNDVFVSVTEDNEPYEVYDGCPYVNLPIDEAEKFAEEKLDNGEWEAYLIPDLVTNRKIIYH